MSLAELAWIMSTALTVSAAIISPLYGAALWLDYKARQRNRRELP